MNDSQDSPISPESRETPGAEKLDQAAELARALLPFLRRPEYTTYFEVWQRFGLHVVPVHPHSPIPDTRRLSPDLWRNPHEPAGLEMNDALQLYFLTELFPRFRAEYERLGSDPSKDRFSVHKGPFAGTDVLVLYCMVRHFEPRKLIAIGAGAARPAMSEAVRANGTTELLWVEGEAKNRSAETLDGLGRLVSSEPQELPLDFFDQLGPGDILFVDSSHVVKVGGDVNFLVLDVLPRLRPGVVVHFHDIFLPMEMPWRWISREKHFWTEQYLLRAFLTFNSEFEVLFANAYMGTLHAEKFKRVFPDSPWWGGGSFWVRRRLGHRTTQSSR